MPVDHRQKGTLSAPRKDDSMEWERWRMTVLRLMKALSLTKCSPFANPCACIKSVGTKTTGFSAHFLTTTLQGLWARYSQWGGSQAELPLLQQGAHSVTGEHKTRSLQSSVPDGGSKRPAWPANAARSTWVPRSSPDGATEQHWLLGNDGEFAPEVSQANVTDSHAVDLDAASR